MESLVTWDCRTTESSLRNDLQTFLFFDAGHNAQVRIRAMALSVLPLFIFIYPKFNDLKSVVCNHNTSGEIQAQSLLVFLLISRLQCMKNVPGRPR